MTYVRYGPSVADVAGYSYNASQYCRDCMWEIACGWLDLPADLRQKMRQEGTEGALDLAADRWGVDRKNERAFDSGDFPKVILEGDICQEDCGDDSCDHEEADCGHDTCRACGGRLCEQ